MTLKAGRHVRKLEARSPEAVKELAVLVGNAAQDLMAYATVDTPYWPGRGGGWAAPTPAGGGGGSDGGAGDSSDGGDSSDSGGIADFLEEPTGPGSALGREGGDPSGGGAQGGREGGEGSCEEPVMRGRAERRRRGR